MASLGNQKEALLKQIEGLRNKITVDKIIPLLERYDDLSTEDFRGRIPDEIFAQLRNPQEAGAWNAIMAANTDGELALRDAIGRISDFIKKFPDSDKLAEAENLKKKYETDLVSMKIWMELEKAQPSSQREIGHEIQRLTEFIDKYPSFSKIDVARKRRDELESRIDNSLWQRAWAQIVAVNPADRSQCESLLKSVNNFLEEYPSSPKLDEAIALKSALENKIVSFDGEEKALDLEWKGLNMQQPSSIDDYEALLAKVSAFIYNHSQWSKIDKAKALENSLKSKLEALRSQQKADQERAERERAERERAEREALDEKKWMNEWAAINSAASSTAAEKKALIDRLTRFLAAYPACPKHQQASDMKVRLENELKAMQAPAPDADKKKGSIGKIILWIVLGILVLLGLLFAIGMFTSDDADDDTVVEEQPVVLVEDTVAEAAPAVPERPSDDPRDKPKDKPKDKPAAKPAQTPAADPAPAQPAVPTWVKDFQKINRTVKGGQIQKIEFKPDQYNPTKVIITVSYPSFSKASMTPADHETVKNLNKDIILQHKGEIPVDVDIRVKSLDVDNKSID